MTSALDPETCTAPLPGAALCARPGMEHNPAITHSARFWVAQRFSAANKAFLSRGALAPVVARLLILPPLPPAPAASVEFASVPARARWNRTTPAKCVPHHPTPLHRLRSLPVAS